MKYPNFIKDGDLVGITALSSGTGNDIKEVKVAINHLKEHFKLIVTPNVYGNQIVSSDIEKRIQEFNELLNEDIKMLLNIRGGDFSLETIDRLNLENIVKKKILVEGFSDITSLVYVLTTKYDYMTFYGLNAKSFDDKDLLPYQLNNIEFMKGHFLTQHSFNDRKTISLNGDFTSSGVILGGCLDVIRYLVGTNLDNTLDFIHKYCDKKIIWYFDIFAMNSVDTYLTLLQFKRIGFFDYTDTILIGSIIYPKVECELDYREVYKKIFEDKNVVYDANIGHVEPVFTMVNGSLGTVTFKDNNLSIKQEIMDENNS